MRGEINFEEHNNDTIAGNVSRIEEAATALKTIINKPTQLIGDCVMDVNTYYDIITQADDILNKILDKNGVQGDV